MSKRLVVNLVVGTFCLGTFFGVFLHWLFTDRMPDVRQERLSQAAQKSQEEMNMMVRSGNITGLKAGEITITVQHSGDPAVKEGSTLKAKTDNMTTLQEGNRIVSKYGQESDLTQYLKAGMRVDLLVKGDKAIAVHWEGQGQPPAQAGQVQKLK